jgi:hypothetical protein
MPESKIFDSATHVVQIEAIIHQHQESNNLADTSRALLRVDDAWVLTARSGSPQGIIVLREDHTSSVDDVLQLLVIGCILQSGSGRGCDINTAHAEAASNRVRHVLIKMKSNHAGLAFRQVGRGRLES